MMSSEDFARTDTVVDIKRLLFRRQFLLGSREFRPNQYWSCAQLQHGLHLSVHADLPFFSESVQDVTVTLLGCAIDPYQPGAKETEILRSLLEQSSNLDQMIDATTPLAGRWVVIFQDDKGTSIFTDPCGFRQVYYHRNKQDLWCASQPELIKKKCRLQFNKDSSLLSFLTHPGHAEAESPWFGPSTIYENCFHLMPNHYLNVDQVKQVRFYPHGDEKCKAMPEIVQSAAEILQGAMTAIVHRHKVSMALTAGVDTRVLLAASRHVSNEIDYFVYRQKTFGSNHPDIWIPKKLSKKLDVQFAVRTPTHHLPGWFIALLSQNATCARVLPKTCNIYDKLLSGDSTVNINGNASEICRNFFDKQCSLDLKNVSTDELVSRLLGKHGISAFVVREIDEWRRGLESSASDEGLNILDLLYWEQRLGNWGAAYPAEQDIAVEEISPFNCRELIRLLSASPRKLRAAPDYPLYRALIREMWPEALVFPINPQHRIKAVGTLRKTIRQVVPAPVLHSIKKMLK